MKYLQISPPVFERLLAGVSEVKKAKKKVCALKTLSLGQGLLIHLHHLLHASFNLEQSSIRVQSSTSGYLVTYKVHAC